VESRLRSEDFKIKKGLGHKRQDNDEKDLIRAKNTAYRYLTYRSRSCKEVEKKLEKKKFDAIVIRAVMDHLIRFGYIDDSAFAAQWAYGRFRLRGFGRRRIERELNQKGVDKNTIQEMLGKTITLEDERQAARKVAEQKLNTMKNVETEVRRRRLAGFLERKGYSYDIIRAMLSMAG